MLACFDHNRNKCHRISTHVITPPFFFSVFQHSKLHGGTMKAASGAIQLLFVLFSTPLATGTRALTEFWFVCVCACVCLYVWV